VVSFGAIRGNLKIRRSALYKLGRNSLSQEPSNSAPESKPRRWSIVSAGLLLLALALVVIYTSRPAFASPLALVVVAAIGLAALLVQLRIGKNKHASLRSPLWLNVTGLILAVAAVFADYLRLNSNIMLLAALGAVVCFGVSGAVILRDLRKTKL
jgi:uncharacterized membrane protein HdeD (DUF308 family)